LKITLCRDRVSRAGLEAEGHKLVRHEHRQVVLVAEGGRIFAIANRCSDAGYPLSEGTLGRGCVLACNWHNRKFDLASGTALDEDFAVALRDRVDPHRLAADDLRDPPAAAQRARAFAGFDACEAVAYGFRVGDRGSKTP
jgi:nitrite reductase/ring-hydroxylating ferredoxin subunit